jgi:hypothetical protein
MRQADTNVSKRNTVRTPRKLLLSKDSEHQAPTDLSTTTTDQEKSGRSEEAAPTSSIAGPALTPVEINVASAPEVEGPSPVASVRDQYPLPLAYSWSLLASLWDPRDRFKEQLRHAENMVAFLGSVSLALLDDQDYKEARIDIKAPLQRGISFGVWRSIAQKSAEVLQNKDHPLASAICWLNIGSEVQGFGADVAALISARNDYHHNRGPQTIEELATASNEAQERLQRCMEALSFFTQYPIRLVQDFDFDRRSGEFLLGCLRLTGDGPGFPQERIRFPRPLPRSDLVLDLGSQNWVSLYTALIDLAGGDAAVHGIRFLNATAHSSARSVPSCGDRARTDK